MNRREFAAAVAAAGFLASAAAAAAADNCFSRVKKIIVDHLGVEAEKVTLGANLIDDLGADNNDVIELVMAIEQEFRIKISDADADKFKTVGDLVAYLRKLDRC